MTAPLFDIKSCAKSPGWEPQMLIMITFADVSNTLLIAGCVFPMFMGTTLIC